jgi:hypothetical protein
MATPVKLEFWEGMNRSVSDNNMKTSEFKIVVNAVSEKIGSKIKRKGYTTYLNNPDNKKVVGLYNWRRVDGSNIQFRRSGTNLYKCLVGSDTSWQTCSLPSGVSLSNGVRMSFAPLAGKIFFADGTNFFYTADGTTFTNVTTGTPPKPAYLEVFQNRLYAAGSTTTISGQVSNTGPSSLYWSKGGTTPDGSNWTVDLKDATAAGYKYIDPDYNGKIVALKKAFDRLLIFKQDAQYKYDGATLVDLNPVTTTSNGSIATYKDFTFWLNYDGIWGYSGTTPQIISVPIYDIIENISASDLNDAQGIVYNRHYYLSIGTVTLDNLTITNGVLDLDWDKSQWALHDFADKPTAWTPYIDSSGNKQLMFGDSAGNTYTMFSGSSDNGKPIQEVLQTAILDEGIPEVDKVYKKVYVEASPCDSMVVQYSVNGGDWLTLGDLYSSLTKHYFNPLKIGAYAKNIQFRIIDNSTEMRPEFKRLIYYIDTAGGTK